MMLPQRLQHVSSGGLALLVHGLLLLGLMVGVSWKNPPQLPIEADLWSELPAPPLAPPEYAPQPDPLPQPAPAAEPAPSADADIALEKAEKKRQEELRRQESLQLEAQLKLEKQLAEEKRLEEKRQEAERLAEQQRIESERLVKERVEKEKREQNRRLLEQELARQERESQAAEAAQLKAEAAQMTALQNQARASTQTRTVLDFQDRIRTKIHNALVMPQSLRGDAEVEFQVSLLPNGEVLRVNLVKTSGQPLYDRAVERAISKASPLPLPSDREAARQFREGLTLKFRPSEAAVRYP